MMADNIAKQLDAIRDKHDLPPKPVREIVSSGSLGVDLATRLPGFPRGVIVDLYGSEGLGKTTWALTMIAERIKHKERCVYIDVEHRINPDLVDIIIGESDLFTILNPKDGDAALAELQALAAIPEIKMIVMDSVAALIPKAALDNPDKSYTAAVAIAMNDALKRLSITVYANDAIVLFINQVRSTPMSFGPMNNQVPTGGRALKFYASLRMHMVSNAALKVGDQIIGQKVDIIMSKNSYRAPHGRTSLNIMFGEGVDKFRDVLDWALEYDIVHKSSSWYTYGGIKANGETAFIKEMGPVYEEICAAVKAECIKREADRKAQIRGMVGKDAAPPPETKDAS
jgi:recombination protein RecA